jgi:PucR C-terminal helix-turn-helix domain/GGDEF-like domain
MNDVPDAATDPVRLLAAELHALRPASIVPLADPVVADLSRRFLADAISRLTDGEDEEQCRAADAGRELVAAGVTADEALDAFRACARVLWDQARTLARAQDQRTYRRVLEQAADMWLEFEHWTSAVADAYREAARHRDQRAAAEREAYVGALLTGAGGNLAELRRSADALGLPKSGRFCVVVAERGRDGGHPFDLAAALRSYEIHSVWQVGLSEYVGVVSLPRAASVGQVKDLLHRTSSGRVGLSAPYDQLGHTPVAARLAHVALGTTPPRTHGVSQYGERPLETLVASAPETSSDMAAAVLGRVLALPAHDRDLLLDTLTAWYETGGNINRTADRLYCHRNTVRYRLNRLSTLTGRPLTEPYAAAETAIALQAYRLHGS